MPPEDGNENTDENGGEGGEENETKPKTTSGKVMREKLETTLTENQSLKGQLLIFQSGLGHLTEKQQKAVISVHDSDAEMSKESLAAVAKELGYEVKDPTAKSKGTEGKGEGADNGSEDGEGDNANDDADDDSEPLDNMDAIERANKRSTVVASSDFDTKLKNAKSAGEVEALIRTEGHKVGIVHELDVE